MNEHRRAMATACGLALLGLACVAWRSGQRQRMPGVRGDSFWRLTYEIDLEPAGPGALVRIALPENTAKCRVYQASYTHPDLWMDTTRGRHTEGRQATALALYPPRRARFVATFDIHVSEWHAYARKGTALSTSERARALKQARPTEANSALAADVAARLLAGKLKKDEAVERIFSYCADELRLAAQGSTADAADALQAGAADPLGRAKAMVALCRACRIPARLVAGFVLEPAPDAKPHVWVEAQVAKRWAPYDPTNGYRRELPATFLPVCWDSAHVVRPSKMRACRSSFSIEKVRSPAGLPDVTENRLLGLTDLTYLPLGMQRTLSLLLLLPVGALITALLRNVVGLQTFGTFTPALLALGLVDADVRTGALVLVLVLGVGLTTRLVLSHLALLMVPRLSLVLTVVVVCMALAAIALHHTGLTASRAAVVFPVVILTMMIERFHVSAEEDGRAKAVRSLLSTLGVGLCCLALLRWDALSRLMLTYPESQFFVMAALILIGRYGGYRLTELLRFRGLTGTGPQGGV